MSRVLSLMVVMSLSVGCAAKLADDDNDTSSAEDVLVSQDTTQDTSEQDVGPECVPELCDPAACPPCPGNGERPITTAKCMKPPGIGPSRCVPD